MRVLLLAQDLDESAVLALALQRVGFTIQRSVQFDAALETWAAQPADLVVMAVEGDVPLRWVRRLRGITEVPLILVTDAIPEATHIALLDAGTDLVIARPMSARLLMAQLRALLRRTRNGSFFALPTMTVAEVTLDPTARSVQIGASPPKRLTHLEFRLFYTLMLHREQVVPAESLVEHVWGYEGEGDRDLVRGLVSRLRAKIEPDPRRPRYIVTIPGIGYAFMREAEV